MSKDLQKLKITIHPRYAGKILEALELAQVNARTLDTDSLSRIVIAADYEITANVVGTALGKHIAKAPESPIWRRWLSGKVIAFAMRVHGEPGEGGF